MSSSGTKKRVDGKVEEIGGAIKKTVGKVIGNEQMEVEGRLAELEGQGRQEVAKAGERIKGAVQELVGDVKNNVGDLIDNQQMQFEGAVKALEGKARQQANH
jgi:uncharacterized protein YjbJ (UPF0337 family)